MGFFDFLNFTKKRREKIAAQPFPAEWLAILKKNMPYYAELDEADKLELQKHIKIFIAERNFIGCGGQDITDEVRVTIAAQACVLLIHCDHEYRTSLKTIFVYPHHYIASGSQMTGAGMVLDGPSVRLGESWHRGPVVLSWDDVLGAAADVHDGRNVVFHEFAHQLDDEHGGTNGAPHLEKRSSYVAWARVLGGEYEKLVDKTKHHRKTLIDKYGATNPAEFFAVITETFFEKPTQMERKHPELYEQLKEFYHQDPAERLRQNKDKK